MLNKMEEDLKLIRSQLSSLCEAFTQVKDCAKLILGRLDSQDDRLDQITKQLAHIFDSSNNEKTSFKALKYASDKQANASSPALTNMGVAPQSLNLIDKVKEPLPEIAPLVTSKSSPSLHTNENSKKGKKYTKKRAKSSVPPCRQRINRHIKRKIADELQDKEKIRPRPDAIETKQEKKKSHFPAKKISCESGVFSSDELYSEDCTDEVIYETALSEEEIDIPQPATIEHGQLNASDSLATGQNASEVINTQSQQQKPEQRQSPVPHKSEPRPDFGSRQQSDSEQTQNLNRAGSQSPGCVVTQPQENNIRDQSDVTVAVYQAVGADNANKGDKGPLGHVEMFLAPAQPHKLPEGRRASYAGLTTNEKQTAQHKLENKDEGADMTPATIPTGEITRAHSSCDIRRNDTMKSDSGDMCIDRRLIDVKRQFSDSSTSSAPGGIQITIGADTDSDEEQIEIALPSIPAPAFSYRSVTVKNSTYKHFYDLKEQLGGGRFGKVYRCVEKKTGLQLAAKCFVCKKPVAKSLLKSKSLKRSPNNLKTKRTQQEPVDKEDVMIEIAIMNLIDHENVVKLYDAFENDNAMTLIMEYLSGGELFERVIADQSQLTELDAVLFMQQITKAVQYLHKNLILHLDLKPENILCLNRTTHHLKIIDFGLARKYKPRQKLVVQWGTPEFMAPEVLNYEVVSFASDMWSMGVICYILLSGISPFLGDCDSDTMENIADCAWDFEEEPFKIVSEEGKDFISRLLVAEKSGRMSATQCLRHEWLSTPLTSRRRKALMNKNKLKVFLARMHWKAGIAAVTAANWLKSKVNTENDIESAV